MKNQKNLPSGWTMAPLRDVAMINPSQPSNVPPDNALVSFVPMAAVEELSGRMNTSAIRIWSDVKNFFTRFQEGDIVFAKITPSMENGKVALADKLVNGVAAGTTEFHVFRPTSGLTGRYLLYYLLQETVRRRAMARMTGTAGQLRVPTQFFEEEDLPLPPAPEQLRIVDAVDSYLTRLDDAVGSLEQVQAKLTAYRASVLKAAVEGRLVQSEASLARAEKRDYEPAEVLLERILEQRRCDWEEDELAKFRAAGKQPKNDNWRSRYEKPAPNTKNLPTLPEGWCWATVDILGSVKGGLTKGQRRHPKQELHDVPYLRVANVQRGYLDLRQVKTIPATAAEIKELRLQRGDVLFNEGGDRDKLGRGWIWDGEIEVCIHQNHVFRVRIFTSDLQPKLLSWYGNTSGRKYFFDEGKQTTNLASINMTKLKLLPVPIAPRREQERIVNEVSRLLSAADEISDSIAHNIKRCIKLREAVLMWAFEGKLADQDLTDEPANELLARIHGERAAVSPVNRARRRRASGAE